MKCHACDKKLTPEEYYECGGCFECENENHISRLIRNIGMNRMGDSNWTRFDELIVAAINHGREKSGLERIGK